MTVIVKFVFLLSWSGCSSGVPERTPAKPLYYIKIVTLVQCKPGANRQSSVGLYGRFYSVMRRNIRGFFYSSYFLLILSLRDWPSKLLKSNAYMKHETPFSESI